MDTLFPADSLEFCPSPAASDLFVCGTYKLDDDQLSSNKERTGPQHRRGQCLLLEVQDNDAEVITFQKLWEFDLPAVLDMKWCHMSDTASPLLAIADSEGNITVHELNTTARRLEKLQHLQLTPDTLCLSLDWSDRRTPQSSPGSLIVSLSNGTLCLLRPTEPDGLSVEATWHAHDNEPWIAAWNYWDSNIIYSGGDDLKLKTWDIRQGFTAPVSTNKGFDAGVTAIQSHPHIENLLAVGSYNDTVYLFDTRNTLRPLTHVNVGGGAWRVKWHPSVTRKHDLLVASMHDGFKIVQFDNENQEGNILKRFDSHESLAYGVDWSFAPPRTDGSTIIGSCSFYDHKLHVWHA